MKPYYITLIVAFFLTQSGGLLSHCQMPCGIYHDDLVYDQIDQYIETMYKGITVLTDSKFDSVKNKNEFVRWVFQKEKESDDTAKIILTYFLQQKIKPGEDDTVKKVTEAHKLLFLLVTIKQCVDRKFIEEFAKIWENFKLMFHREGYECEMEKKSFNEWNAKKKAKEEAEAHAHPH